MFAKPPVPGKVKTRLAARVGDTHAADLARAFLADTWETVSSATWARAVLATTEHSSPSDFALPGQPNIWLQGEGDLGERLERIIRRGLKRFPEMPDSGFRPRADPAKYAEYSSGQRCGRARSRSISGHLFTGADFVIAIGADTPGLPERLLAQARDELRRADAVLGPSDDGGFYLVGLKRCPQGIFDDLPWSEPTTFAATRERLRRCGMDVRILEPWFDVDQPADLDRLRSAIESGSLHAPRTRRLLTALPQGEAPCG